MRPAVGRKSSDAGLKGRTLTQTYRRGSRRMDKDPRGGRRAAASGGILIQRGELFGLILGLQGVQHLAKIAFKHLGQFVQG